MSGRARCSAALLGAAALGWPAAAAADEEAPTASGTIGGALVGAELVLIGEAVLDIEPVWPFVLGGVAGAGLGGYVGYRVERDATRETSLTLAALGVALIIPTIVWVGAARAPEVDDEAPAPPAVVRIEPDRIGLGTPALEVHPVFSRRELAVHSVAQRHELRLALFSGAF